jgi:hypothetical protein
MRNTPLRGFMKSPLRQEYKNTKTATESTGKYSHANTKGNVGDKIANAVTPKNEIELIPVASKAVKLVKAGINLYKGA